MKIAGYQYQSCFGTFIEEFIREKKEAGFVYESEEWQLKHFDAFCEDEGITEPCLNKNLVEKWGTIREGEEMVTCSRRISVLRQLGLYLASLGIEAYIPCRFYKKAKKVVHVLPDDEIKDLFRLIDEYRPAIQVPFFYRLSMEYRVIFRLIYCCGLRISEARTLKQEDVDLKNGRVRILEAKGHKDRFVYLADDLAELLQEYMAAMKTVYDCQSDWVFPSRDPEKCLTNGTLDKRFRESWAQTPFAKDCDRDPTVHCLRHSFVVKRMNLWMEEDVPLREMLPFLSKYLGHSSPDESFYYYHQMASAFSIVRKQDKTSAKVIPEVTADE